MIEPSEIFYLAMTTLGLAVAYGIWQLTRVRKAKREDESSAFTEHPSQ